jgi:hypothetical protein
MLIARTLAISFTLSGLPNKPIVPELASIPKRTRPERAHHRASSLAIRAFDGCLLGNSRGKWGGELVSVSARSAKQIVLNSSVQNLYFIPFASAQTSELSHLHLGDESVYLITRADNGGVAAAKVEGVRGAPFISRRLSNGRLLIENEHGSIALNSGAALVPVVCREYLEQAPI